MDLAHHAGLHPTYIGQLENGRRNLALLNMLALANALQVEVQELLGPPDPAPSRVAAGPGRDRA